MGSVVNSVSLCKIKRCQLFIVMRLLACVHIELELESIASAARLQNQTSLLASSLRVWLV